MVKDLPSSRSRSRAPPESSPTSPETKRDKFQKPFPVNAGADRGPGPKGLPPTPPSDTESYSLQRNRSQSQPARERLSSRSSGSSDYDRPQRTRLDTVRDEDDRPDTEMRRTKSVGGRTRSGESRQMNRSLSRRDIDRRRQVDEEGDDIYGVYDDYYEEKPLRTFSTRRPLQRGLSRSRTGSLSRGRRSVEDEDDYGSRYSEGEDEEFEMVTPKRSEISKVTANLLHSDKVDQSQSQNGRYGQSCHDPCRY
jgi:hypothetical protein